MSKKMDVLERIQVLSDIPGVSGWEDPVREEILRQLEGVCECRVDPMGNLLAFKKGAATPKNKLLFSAHMDEVGYVVTHIEDSGLLRFTTVGGVDNRVIPGKGVEVGPDRIYGVIGMKALHHASQKERAEPLSPDKLLIDIGAESREEAEALVHPGDRAVFHSQFRRIGGDKLLGRALDDRAGCALLVELVHRDLPFDLHISFTVQEETGCTGAVGAGYAVDPDIAVAVETTTASDIAGVEPHKVVCSLGKGPVVSFMDRGTVYDHSLYRLALDAARQGGIPCQSKEGVFGGNESRSLQTARGGARVMGVSLPCRYLHTPSNMLQESDILHTLELLSSLVPLLGNL